MIVKNIAVRTRPGRQGDYLRLQRRWNEVMERQPGFLWCHVGVDVDDPASVLVVIAFSTMADLDRFMAGPHDDLVAETMIDQTYSDIRVAVYDVVESRASSLR